MLPNAVKENRGKRAARDGQSKSVKDSWKCPNTTYKRNECGDSIKEKSQVLDWTIYEKVVIRGELQSEI